MPSKSEMILVGNLASQDMKLCTTEFFMHNKKICGFNLERYLIEEINDDRRNEFKKLVQDDINAGGKLFGTTIAKEMSLD